MSKEIKNEIEYSRCPELEACISSVLWCDGIRHCPSGFDEREENCSYRFGTTLLYVAVGTGTLGIFLILLLATGCVKYCLYRRRRIQRRLQLQKKLPQDTDSIDGKKKKVQVLNVKQLSTPTSNHTMRANNGLDITAGITNSNALQPRYANAAFARIGRYDPNNHNQQYHQHYQQHLQYQQQTQPLEDEDDQREYEEKIAKDSIC